MDVDADAWDALAIAPPEAPSAGTAGSDDPWAPLAPPSTDGGGDPMLDALEDADAPEATEDQVRDLLKGTGSLAHRFAGDDDVPDHWRFTDDELDRLVPPLTRVVNRRAPLRRLVAKGDGLFVALVMGEYFDRNLTDGADARRARKEIHVGDVRAEDRDVPAGDPSPGGDGEPDGADRPWGAGLAPGEADGIGRFQG